MQSYRLKVFEITDSIELHNGSLAFKSGKHGSFAVGNNNLESGTQKSNYNKIIKDLVITLQEHELH